MHVQVSTTSAAKPDWSRERREQWWEPSKALLLTVRDYQRALVSNRHMMMKIAVLRHRFWSIVSGADIPLNSKIGGGLLLPHPNGVVIHPGAEIGPNCLFFQQVTIGHAPSGIPRIGGQVVIGAGAKVLGAVSIGDRAVIGANAVVTSDIPDGATAVGIPARVIKAKRSNKQPVAPHV